MHPVVNQLSMCYNGIHTLTVVQVMFTEILYLKSVQNSAYVRVLYT